MDDGAASSAGAATYTGTGTGTNTVSTALSSWLRRSRRYESPDGVEGSGATTSRPTEKALQTVKTWPIVTPPTVVGFTALGVTITGPPDPLAGSALDVVSTAGLTAGVSAAAAWG